MSKITAISAGKRNEKRVRLFLDGKFVCSLEKNDAVRNGLQVGLELSADRINTLLTSLQASRVFNAACRYLAYRPRSEAELRERLLRRGFESGQIDGAITRLKEQNLLDDADFARFWKENRETFSPRSRWLTGQELRQKGVSKEVIDEVVADIDESESAYQAALSRARRLSCPDYESFRQKMVGYLQRRGFGYGVISQAVNRVWQEIKEEK